MNEATNKEVRIATYNEHKYRLLYLGPTKHGQRAHLAYLDSSKDFWVDAEKVAENTDGQTLAEVKKPVADVASVKRPAIAVGATVGYKGHEYKLKWSGDTKFGYRAILLYLDGSKEFWVDANAVTTNEAQPEEPATPPSANEHPAPRFSATPKAAQPCSLCREAPSEIEHPEYAGDMICGECYVMLGAPF